MPRGRKKAVVKVDIPEDTNNLLREWYAASKQLEEVKAKEAPLRLALVAKLFDAAVLEGSSSVDIGYGYELKVNKKMNYKATNDNSETLDLLNALGAVDPTLAAALIKWSPDMSIAIYRQVLPMAEQHPEIKAALARAITAKPGMPELEMIAPKEEPAQA